MTTRNGMCLICAFNSRKLVQASSSTLRRLPRQLLSAPARSFSATSVALVRAPTLPPPRTPQKNLDCEKLIPKTRSALQLNKATPGSVLPPQRAITRPPATYSLPPQTATSLPPASYDVPAMINAPRPNAAPTLPAQSRNSHSVRKINGTGDLTLRLSRPPAPRPTQSSRNTFGAQWWPWSPKPLC